jgi:hypothetical protein
MNEVPKGFLALTGIWATWLIAKLELATALLFTVFTVDLVNVKLIFEIVSFGTASTFSVVMIWYYLMRILFPKKYNK